MLGDHLDPGVQGEIDIVPGLGLLGAGLPLDDSFHIALENPEKMRELEKRYNEQYHYLQSRGNEPADPDAFAVVDRMSSGDRLWYRVGARMAARVEQQMGRDALVALIAGGHPALVETYRRVVAGR